MNNSSEIFLLKTEENILKCLSKSPCSLSDLTSMRRFSRKPDWYIAHCLDRLEEKYLLIEELSPAELDALQHGQNYMDLSVCTAVLSGKYTLTDTGRLVREAMADATFARWREVLIPMVSAVLGAVFGALSSLAVNFFTP